MQILRSDASNAKHWFKTKRTRDEVIVGGVGGSKKERSRKVKEDPQLCNGNGQESLARLPTFTNREMDVCIIIILHDTRTIK